MARPGTVLALLMGSVLRLIREADRQIIVEGVESEERLEEVRGMGAAGVQGYVFGPPVQIADLAARLKRPISPRISRFRSARTA
jgi:EAL domain-containing protein (putative c-di-GMP-specific phosphodiesterase class I)